MTSLVVFGWVFQMTQSPAWVGIAVMCHRMPILFGSFFFSPVASKTPAKIHGLFDVLRACLLAGMACLIGFANAQSESILIWIFAFLILASLRSLLSGADYAAESKLVSFYSGDNKSQAADLQQLLSSILGASGLIASALFVAGALSVSLVGVVIFDTLSFLLCGFYFLRLSKFLNEPTLTFNSERLWRVNILKVAYQNSSTATLLTAHFFRTIGTAVGLQQWLLLLQVKFGLGTNSMGYLYMAITAGWFFSAQFVRYYSLRFTTKQFLLLSIAVCVLVPVGWYMPNMFAVGVVTFVIGCVDGSLLASLSGDLQRRTNNQNISAVFGAFTILTQTSVVLGSIFVGLTSESLGYTTAAWMICSIVGFALLIQTFAYRETSHE